MKRFSTAAPIALLAALAACDSGAPPANDVTPQSLVAQTTAVSRFRDLPADIQMQVATTAAFPGPEGATARIGDDIHVFSPQKLAWMGDTAVLFSGGQTEDCHACTGTLAVHYLKPVDNGLEVVGGWLDAATGTSFGGPPEWRIRTDLAPNPVIQAEGGGTWQGHSCRYAELVELTPQGPVKLIDGVPLSYADGSGMGDGKPADYAGKIEAGEPGASFTVQYSGTRSDKITYRRAGTSYKAAPGSPDLSGC
jgi:hypothetical protein